MNLLDTWRFHSRKSDEDSHTLGFPLSDKPTDFAIRGRYLQESPADGFQLEVTAQGLGGVQPKGPA